MDRLQKLVGAERSVKGVCETLHFVAASQNPPVTGAVLVTCADETEREAAEAFQAGFVQYLLPALKFAQRAPFRVSNLAGRYEWGAVRIAEQHFATAAAHAGYQLLVIKVNSHAAVPGDPELPFGVLERYRAVSPCCGGLAAFLDGSKEPFAQSLEEVFASEGKDRAGALRDPERVDPRFRNLYAALVSARLQARTALLDIQDYVPASPTLYLVVPCVTLNRLQADSEIVCGYYLADAREKLPPPVTWFGLGDDPAEYRAEVRNGHLRITDPHLGDARAGRDHRRMVLERWRERKPTAEPVRDRRLERIRGDVARNKHRDHRHANALLGMLLPVLAEVAPVPAAVLLFANGLGSMHHVYKVHRLARRLEGDDDAREMLEEIRERVDRLEPDRAEAMIELLMNEYRG